MLAEVVAALPQTITAVVSDAQPSIRNAVASALPNKPHQLCHYHYYKEAFKPLTEADRHAKKELKKLVRGVRPIERTVSEEQEPIGEVVKGYCLAVRSALTDEGHPPLDPPGVKLHQRLTKIHSSLEGVKKSAPPALSVSERVRTEQAGATSRTLSNIEGYFSYWS